MHWWRAQRPPSSNPYAGWDTRQIKALSAEQIDDLRNGRGMRMALPAELNGYPGPRHVLDLADQLELSAEQRAQAQRLFDEMQARAILLGEQLIAEEATLDRLFLDGSASNAGVEAVTAKLGQLQSALRAHHLGYHIAMRDLLSPHQVVRYQQLRGYGAGGAEGHGGHKGGAADSGHHQ